MLCDLTHVIHRTSRSISAENLSGEPGMGGRVPLEQGSARRAARELGTGWKVNPYTVLGGKSKCVLADIHGMGMINHIWWAGPAPRFWRDLIIRMYWDDNENPSVECSIGDFFCMGWQKFSQINSLPVCINPGSGFNCYWDMPFRTRAYIELENRSEESVNVYYQVDYCFTEIPEDITYFHAQFRRTNPVPYKQDYTILDGVKGRGHYVGTYMSWGVNNNGWWGEGEIKFFMDGDTDYPTICGTGTEDYFGGSYDFEDPINHDKYIGFSGPYTGLQVLEPNRLYTSQMRFGLYRWHLSDPVCFEKSLKVTIQDLGWRSGGRYLPQQDDISSVAFWYQQLPAQKFPPLPDRDYMEVI